MATFGPKMAQLQSKALEAAMLAAKHGKQLQSKAFEATMQAAEQGSAYQKQLQAKASEATRFAAEQGSAYQKQLQSKACEATRFAARQGSAYHRSLMERNKQYVVDPPTVEKCRELSKQLFYTRLASLPGRYESFWKEVDGAKLLLTNRKNLKVEDLGVAALFGIELYAWLCTGEIIGRGFTLTGYDV
ncbi:uncharacterized protein [Lolium perenne]|uniref:uncharacterized protein n=1 Tax=Lolium perenne TaxID=4522 RepID=UPI0021EAA944|nr:uncharacterized protein LOC127338574 [Lolium perenne]